MDFWVLVLLVFLTSALIALTIGLVVRDLRAARLATTAAAAPRFRLQRVPPREAPQGVSIDSFDRWFVQLLRDAGLDWNPTLAALLVVLWGMLCGGALFFFDERVAPACVAGALAACLPMAMLVILRARRLAKLQDQLPAALETLARSLRAGQTLEQGIAMLGGHSPDPLAGEFRWCAKQQEMGLGLAAVMRSLVQRLNLYDVRIFATTLVVHRQMGGNVVAVLERLAQVIRERSNYRRHLRATTATGRMSAGLVGLVAPAVFLYFFFARPDYAAQMLHDPLGQGMLLTTALLEIVGVVWIIRLLRPTY